MSASRTQTPEVALLGEPKVLGKSSAETDCKRVLLGGPYAARAESHSNRISVGLIGTYSLVDRAKKWLSQVNEPIESKPEARDADALALERHKLLFPDFPGCPVAFEKTVVSEPQFEQKIALDELKHLDKSNEFTFIEGLLKLIEAKIGYEASALELLVQRCKSWHSQRQEERRIKHGDRVAVLGRGIAIVERFDGKEVHAVLWNRSLLKFGLKEIVWDESNARWETDASGHLVGLGARH